MHCRHSMFVYTCVRRGLRWGSRPFRSFVFHFTIFFLFSNHYKWHPTQTDVWDPSIYFIGFIMKTSFQNSALTSLLYHNSYSCACFVVCPKNHSILYIYIYYVAGLLLNKMRKPEYRYHFMLARARSICDLQIMSSEYIAKAFYVYLSLSILWLNTVPENKANQYHFIVFYFSSNWKMLRPHLRRQSPTMSIKRCKRKSRAVSIWNWISSTLLLCHSNHPFQSFTANLNSRPSSAPASTILSAPAETVPEASKDVTTSDVTLQLKKLRSDEDKGKNIELKPSHAKPISVEFERRSNRADPFIVNFQKMKKIMTEAVVRPLKLWSKEDVDPRDGQPASATLAVRRMKVNGRSHRSMAKRWVDSMMKMKTGNVSNVNQVISRLSHFDTCFHYKEKSGWNERNLIRELERLGSTFLRTRSVQN